MQRAGIALLGSALIALTGLWLATAFIADVFSHQRALGAPLVMLVDEPVYAPWAILAWTSAYADAFPRPFSVARLIVFGAFMLALLPIAVAARGKLAIKPFGAKAWGGADDARAAGLFADTGAVLGKIGRDILCFDGPEHQLLIGAWRSGKGRGQVVPTLLAWPYSALVLDVKGELADGDARHRFPGTAGFRESLGPVLRLAPTRLDSASFNPLFEVRKGPHEVRDVQNIVEILVDPQGDGRHQDFWDRSAKTILVGVILHVLYAEPPERKTLAVVREKLRDLDATAQQMKSTLHRLNPATNQPEVHPEVLHAAESFLAGEERLQSGVKATAESFFGLFADEIVARNTATSDFRIGDLMCGDRPVTLYLQPPPSDALRLMPFLRLVINQFARTLMEHQEKDAQGRPKRHRLILVLDEFPMLGRMPFFETMMGAMAGYGLKAFLVTQSLNHLTKAYGRENVILDNVHIVTAFSAADNDTAKRIAEMAGEVWELRESETHTRPRSLLGWRKGSTTIREERRPLLLPADVRAMPRDEELIFVSGAKPIRAKKIKFDQEPVFVERLRPGSGNRPTLTTAHDWMQVRALGTIPQVVKQPKAKPFMSRPLVDQPDLFTQAAARPTKISDAAMAGFRDADGAALPHPASGVAAAAPAAAAAAPDEAPRRRRAKGI
ncbi:MAG: type IV secretory system conjugative DNA transfer family protein [Hyphomonadaceae bacterium]|nr:type IV secretory system conjugative DNA transfer family protein [Hyphomonadaceae bacterium]